MSTTSGQPVEASNPVAPLPTQLWMLLVLAACTLDLALTDLSAELRLLVHAGACALTLLLLCATSLESWSKLAARERLRAVLALGVGLGYLLLLPKLPEPNAFRFVFAGACVWLMLRFDPRGAASRQHLPVLVALALFGALALSEELLAWTPGLSSRTASLAAALHRATGWNLELLGFTPLHGWLWLVCGPALACALLLRLRQRAARNWLALPIFLGALAWEFAEPNGVRSWIFCLLAVGCAQAGPASPFVRRSPVPISVAWLTGMIVLLASFRLPAFLSSAGDSSPRKVVLLDGEYSDGVPDPMDPEKSSGAAIGFFLRYLAGVTDLVHASRADAASLAGARCLIVCNASRPFEQDELLRIHGFVQSGGSLLVFGDHTDIFGVMHNTNPLIEPYGIRLQFDSAMPEGAHAWRDHLDARWTPATAALRNADAVHISVGASLGLAGDARPLLIARSGFADAGDRNNPQKAFLGNWSYDPGIERRGELVLAAENSAGEGRVLVFGDTALLQESSFSYSWEFVSTLLQELLGDRHALPSAVWTWLRLALVALVFVWLSLESEHRVLAPVGGLVLMASLSAVVAHERRAHSPEGLSPPNAARVVLTRGSNFSSVHSAPACPEGFLMALAASGFVPLCGDLPVLAPPRGWVVLPYAAAPRTGEQQRLIAALEAGGHVLQFLGPQSRDDWQQLLSALQVEVTGQALGGCPEAEAVGQLPVPHFRTAWAMDVPEAASSGGTEPLVTCWEQNIVLRRSVGSGVFVAIGDPSFAHNDNFMPDDQYQRENFAFLHTLLLDPQ